MSTNKTMSTKKNPIEHVWSILCGQSTVDSQSNNASLFNIIEQVSLNKTFFDAIAEKEMGLAQVPMELVTLWKRRDLNNKDRQTIEVKCVVVDSAGKELAAVEYSAELTSEKRRLRSNLKFSGIPVSKNVGEYHLNILQKTGSGKYEMVGSVPVEVVEKRFEEEESVISAKLSK